VTVGAPIDARRQRRHDRWRGGTIALTSLGVTKDVTLTDAVGHAGTGGAPAGGTVTISAGRDIVDGNNGGTLISAGTLSATAGRAVGAAAAGRIDTTVTTLAATAAGTGGIFIAETDGVTVGAAGLHTRWCDRHQRGGHVCRRRQHDRDARAAPAAAWSLASRARQRSEPNRFAQHERRGQRRGCGLCGATCSPRPLTALIATNTVTATGAGARARAVVPGYGDAARGGC
jgi:hypothetical protein